MSIKKKLSEVHIDIVGGCQLRCVGCPNSTLLPDIKHVDVSKLARVLGNVDVEEIGTLRLFNYGEPLLHKDLPGVLKAVAAQPFNIGCVEISTNAQFARWEQIEEAVKMKVINRFVVSCDGDGTAESFERMRPPAKWSKLIQFLERLRALRDEHDPDLELMTRTVIFEDRDMDLWRKTLTPLGWKPEFRMWKNLVDGLENLSGREVNIGQGLCKFMENPNSLYLDWDGTVVPCCAHPRAAELGNLSNRKFSVVICGDAHASFAHELTHNRGAHPVCSRCEFGPKNAPGPSAGARVNSTPGHSIGQTDSSSLEKTL